MFQVTSQHAPAAGMMINCDVKCYENNVGNYNDVGNTNTMRS